MFLFSLLLIAIGSALCRIPHYHYDYHYHYQIFINNVNVYVGSYIDIYMMTIVSASMDSSV